jgi:predicted phage terminase large subunit-like protein
MIAEDPLEEGDPGQVGESLWPWRFGNAEELEPTKISAGSYTWSSLYQQRPAPAGGLIFNRGWWGTPNDPVRDQFYKQTPEELGKTMDIVIQSWDATFKDTSGTDFVVGQIWGRKGPNYYLLDQTRARMDIIATMQAIRTLSGKWPKSSAKLIEDKANGPGIITMLKRELPGIIPVEPQGGKVVRAQAIVPYIESGNVWLPLPQNASWLHDFIEELSAFPTGKHDDQVDSATQALFHLSTRNINVPLPRIPRSVVRVGGGWNGPNL